MLSELMDGADIGMVERRNSPRFPLKSLYSFRIISQLLGKKLQRHLTAQFQVFCFVNHSHAAAAQDLQHPVVGSLLADQIGCVRWLPRSSLGVSHFRYWRDKPKTTFG